MTNAAESRNQTWDDPIVHRHVGVVPHKTRVWRADITALTIEGPMWVSDPGKSYHFSGRNLFLPRW